MAQEQWRDMQAFQNIMIFIGVPEVRMNYKSISKVSTNDNHIPDVCMLDKHIPQL